MAHVHTFGVVAPAAAGIIQFVSLIRPPGSVFDMPLQCPALERHHAMSLSQSHPVPVRDPHSDSVHIY